MQEFFDPSLDITHFAFDDVGSTNDEAFRLADKRGLQRLFVTAKRQTNGRGRRGRPWISEAGNLYVSILLKAPAKTEKCAMLSFVACVAVREAILDCLPRAEQGCELKWPNDILLHGAKLAGLLLEAREENGVINIVIGIGVNCAHFPADTPYPATSLSAEGYTLSPDDLFPGIKRRFLENLSLWQEGKNFGEIRAKWLRAARGVGQEIIVRLENEEIAGIFRDLDHQGQLVLGQSQRADRIIAAGDVFFPSLTR